MESPCWLNKVKNTEIKREKNVNQKYNVMILIRQKSYGIGMLLIKRNKTF